MCDYLVLRIRLRIDFKLWWFFYHILAFILYFLYFCLYLLNNIEYEEAKVKYDPILSGIKYIDFNYKYEDGLTFLQNLESTGLPKQGDKINWLQVCRYFEELGITDKCLASIITTAKALQGDTVFEKINKLSKITDMDYIELLTKIENIVDLERDFHEQEMEIERLNEIIDNLSKLSIKENVVDSLNQEQTDQVETAVNE